MTTGATYDDDDDDATPALHNIHQFTLKVPLVNTPPLPLPPSSPSHDSTFEASIPRCRIFRIPTPVTATNDTHHTAAAAAVEEEAYTFTRRARLAKQRKIKEKRRRTLLKMNPGFDQLPSQAMAAAGPGLGLVLGGGGGGGGGVSHAYATAKSRGGRLTAAAFTTAGLKGHVQEEEARRSRPNSRAPSPRPLPLPQEGEGENGWDDDEKEEEWGSDNDAYYDDTDDDDDDDGENDDDEDYGSEVGDGTGKAGARGGGTLVTQVSADDSQALYWHGPTHPLTHIKVSPHPLLSLLISTHPLNATHSTPSHCNDNRLMSSSLSPSSYPLSPLPLSHTHEERAQAG